MAKTSRPTNPSAAQKRMAAERAAAARERIQAAQRRRRLVVVGTSIAAVILVVAVLVVVKIVAGGDKPKSGVRAAPAANSVATDVASVPPSVFDAIGSGTSTLPPKATDGTALTGDGKPRVLFVGAEFCPYCAAERWPMTVALARFGTFTGLGQTRSSPSDVYPSTATLAYHGATYTSPYLSFTGKELQTNQVKNGQYTALDTITGHDRDLFEKAGSSYPYINLGGKWIVGGAQYDVSLLQGRTQQQIAAALSTPSSPIAKAIDGAANQVTAKLCDLTGNKPAAVCTSAGVTAAAGA